MRKSQSENQKRKQPSKQSSKNSINNREFAVITYLFLFVFICLMGYIVYFQVVKSEDFINSPYNTRQDSFASRIVRGEIRSADGTVLAQTNVDGEGNETRYYPYSNIYAHVVGFASNGKTGLESTMNFNLLRSHSFALERFVNELQGDKSTGDNVVTTLNTTLQETAYNALGGYQGAVIVMEPGSGKILTMVSKPDFNPNTIAANWESITSSDSTESVLVNRVTQGLYPPGSTFKVLTTLEYIREHSNYDSFHYNCTGSISLDEMTIRCYGNTVHGEEDLKTSFANSCNSAYAEIGMSLNKKKFAGLCESLLFNQALPGGFEYNKSQFQLASDASNGLVMQTAIGQGETLVSPYHMALITSAIANNGILMRPYLVDRTENDTGITVKKYEPITYGELLSEKEAAILQEYMKSVVDGGTGAKLSGQSYEASGKTGSAEFSNNKNESHSWFVGFAHREDKPDIVIAVIAEGAGTGSSVAVPIAKQIFDTYYR